jgi:hypothetical protein
MDTPMDMRLLPMTDAPHGQAMDTEPIAAGKPMDTPMDKPWTRKLPHSMDTERGSRYPRVPVSDETDDEVDRDIARLIAIRRARQQGWT